MRAKWERDRKNADDSIGDSIEDCLEWQRICGFRMQQQLKDIGFRWISFCGAAGGRWSRRRAGAHPHRRDGCSATLIGFPVQEAEAAPARGRIPRPQKPPKLAARVAKASKVIGQLLAAVTDENSNRYREAHEAPAGTKEQTSRPRIAPPRARKLETAAPRGRPRFAIALACTAGVSRRAPPPLPGSGGN